MYTLSNRYVEKSGIRYYVPCPLLPYIDEIITDIQTKTVQQAMLDIASKYGIQLISVKKCPNRLYQQGPASPVQTTTRSLSWFILGETGKDRVFKTDYDYDPPFEINGNTDYKYKMLDSRFLYTNNARFFTYSYYATYTLTFQQMQEGSPTLAKIFSDAIPYKDNIFTTVRPLQLSCRCISVNSSITDQPGYIISDGRDKLLFCPTIHKSLLSLYTPFKTEDIVFFTNIGCSMFDITSEVLYKYTKTKLTPINKTICYRT
jgi:hypothetical protein